MPRLSLDAELDRQLEESRDATRYRDVAIVLRRLTLSATVREGARGIDSSGNAWIAADVGVDGLQPVATEIVGASRAAGRGERIVFDGIEVELVVEIVISGGGVWDTLRRDWKRDESSQRVSSDAPVVVDLMESQIETARWAAVRIAAFRERKPHPQAVAELFSDRRAAKTFMGMLLVIVVAIDCPAVKGELPLVAWLVSTSHPAREELDRIFKAILPGDGKSLANGGYYIYRELPKHIFTLANGSTIQHKTTDVDESLRTGYVDIALLNEAANMTFAVYRIMLRATQDRAGFLVLTTNRPKRTRGGWVVKVAEGAERDEREGREPAVALFRPDPKKNAAIKQEAKAAIDRALRYALEEHEEIDEGVILEADEKCYSPPFDETKHAKVIPDIGWVDATPEILKRLYGRPYSFLIGADFQQKQAASAFRIMVEKGKPQPESWRDFILVAVRAWFLTSGGDEDDLIDLMESEKFTADKCLVVGDCSGAWQKGDRGYGPVTFDTFRRRGWEIVPPTKKKTAEAKFSKNPPVEQSVGKLRNLITAGRFFVELGEKTKQLQRALAKCDASIDRYENLRPKGIHAHLGDTCRYPVWYLETRIAEVATPVPKYAQR